ncbi:hypothetical protein [Nocardia transvalensis]|uniref:hypothetical protein n=1 Tax=Nocardia transvalensis TaxID=37333 RepID=UPI001893DF90|nr:hypothetical protein [Nocardia transvalensis]MBF6332354.1 hypothetical protein [Nocardia transvalensis]
MTSGQPETITIHKTILTTTASGAGVSAGSAVDDQGRWVVRLSVGSGPDSLFIDVVEGDTFQFEGDTWKVTKVFEPSTHTRGAVATISKVS